MAHAKMHTAGHLLDARRLFGLRNFVAAESHAPLTRTWSIKATRGRFRHRRRRWEADTIDKRTSGEVNRTERRRQSGILSVMRAKEIVSGGSRRATPADARRVSARRHRGRVWMSVRRTHVKSSKELKRVTVAGFRVKKARLGFVTKLMFDILGVSFIRSCLC